MLTRLLFTLSLFFATAPLRADDAFSQPQTEAWINGVFDQLKKNGASEASHGLVTYDASSGDFSVVNIKIVYPDTVKENVKTQNAATEAPKTNTPNSSKSIQKSGDNKSGTYVRDYGDEDSKTSKSIKKNIGKPEAAAARTESTDLVIIIPRINASSLKASGTNWTAQKIQLDRMKFEVSGFPGAFEIGSINFDSVGAPQVTAEQLATDTGKQIVTILQNASFAGAIVKNAVFTDDQKNQKTGRLAFGDVVFSDFAKGKAGTIATAKSKGSFMVAAENDEKQTFDVEVGASQVKDFDIGLYADLFLKTPLHAGQKNLSLHGPLTFDGASFKAGETMEGKLNAISATGAKLNMPDKGLMAMMGSFKTIHKSSSVDAEQKEMLSNYQQWVGVTSYDAVDSAGGSLKFNATNLSIGNISGQNVGATIGALLMKDFRFDSPEAKMGFDSVNLKEIDTATFYKSMFEEMARNKEKPDFKSLEGKLPTFGLVEVNALSLQSAKQPPLNVKHMAFSLKSWVKFVPEELKLSIEKMIFPAEAFAGLESPNMKDFGYDSIEFNSDTLFKLDRTAKTAVLSPFKLDFAKAGAISADMVLSNISEDMLGVAALNDPFTQLGAAKFDKFRLQISNGDFVSHYVAWKVKKENKSESDVKKEMADGLKIFMGMIPDADQQKKAQDAVDAFIASPKSLSVLITPKASLSLLDLQLGMMTGGLGLMDKINFDVTANGAI